MPSATPSAEPSAKPSRGSTPPPSAKPRNSTPGRGEAAALLAQLRADAAKLNAELNQEAVYEEQRQQQQQQQRSYATPEQVARHRTEASVATARAAKAATDLYGLQSRSLKSPISTASEETGQEFEVNDVPLLKALRMALLSKVIPVCRQLDITSVAELGEYDYEELAEHCKTYANGCMAPLLK